MVDGRLLCTLDAWGYAMASKHVLGVSVDGDDRVPDVAESMAASNVPLAGRRAGAWRCAMSFR